MPAWDSAKRLIASAKLLDEHARRRLNGEMAASDAQLAPLRDPLTLNLGAHRWLSADREESNSDWLAWILQGMTAAEILPLFGRDDQVKIDAFGAVVRVIRETIIGDKRTDIQVWFTTGLLLIEVKVQPENAKDLLSQLKRYKKWLDAQAGDGKLLVPLGLEETLLQLAAHITPPRITHHPGDKSEETGNASYVLFLRWPSAAPAAIRGGRP